MYRIATLNKISPAGLNQFPDDYTIIDEIEEADGILLRSHDLHDTEFSDNLLAIGRAGAGVNNIPLEKCSNQGIVVFNTPGANANAVKELVIAGMLLSARNIPNGLMWASNLSTEEGDVHKIVEKGKGQFAGSEIKGKTLGIIGLGAIGVMVANAAADLGVKVIGYDPFITIRSAHSLYSSIPVLDDLADLLPQCDYISIHVPANDNTKGMIDSRRFNQMKDGAVFMNFARDTLVNDKALLESLNSGKLRNYVTDFPNNAVLGQMGVIALPHLGASTHEAEDNCAIMAANQIMEYIESGNIRNSVNYPAISLGRIDPEASARICILNKNIPNMLGQITGKMAEVDVNIRNLTNKSKGDFAVTLMDVDGDKDTDTITGMLNDIEGVIRVRSIK